jgi:hypothetical protein
MSLASSKPEELEMPPKVCVFDQLDVAFLTNVCSCIWVQAWFTWQATMTLAGVLS